MPILHSKALRQSRKTQPTTDSNKTTSKSSCLKGDQQQVLLNGWSEILSQNQLTCLNKPASNHIMINSKSNRLIRGQLTSSESRKSKRRLAGTKGRPKCRSC